MENCHLCGGKDREPLEVVEDIRSYYLCHTCGLISVASHHFLEQDEEKKRYLKHQNSLDHQGYLDFLNRIISPALNFLNAEMTLLDFGCGPSPVLSSLLKEKKLDCKFYDPFFYPQLPEGKFDFIFSTETFEHFNVPATTVREIVTLLNPGGFLALMTETWVSKEHFRTWYYKRDPTHVSFYHLNTIQYLCKTFGFKMVYSDNRRCYILRRKKII